MTNKERLKEIEERVLVDRVYYKHLDGTKGHWGKIYTLSEEDYNYLKEQAERVQELENENQILKTVAEINKYIGEQYLEQNKRYREELKNIYELAEYDEYDNTLEQIVSEIKKALEGTE